MKTELHYYIEKSPAIAKCIELHNLCMKSSAPVKNLCPIHEIIDEINALQPGEGVEIGYEGTHPDGSRGEIVVCIEIPDEDGYVLTAGEINDTYTI